MKVFTVLGGFFAAMAVSVVITAATVSLPAHAADKKDSSSQETKKEDKKVDDKVYTYTANLGDSYTQLVRKAVQTYGINNKVDLGNARIVFIETNLTQAAGEPFLTVGEKVSIKQSDVKAWADKALKLNDADVAAWQTYVPFIDFNTNNIGE